MLQEMCDIMQMCYDKGWITSRDGNISLRYANEDHFFISPSGVLKFNLETYNLVTILIQNNEAIVPPGLNPSGELHMHKLLQLNHNETKTVLHVHPTNIIAAMYSGWDLQELAEQFPEIHRYTKVGKTVPILPATSVSLGEATFDALTQNGKIVYDIVGQKRHGICVIADSPRACYEHIERLEHICEIVLKSGKKK